MEIKHSLLDELAGDGINSILVFDCEFWHVLEEGNYILNKDTDYFFIPREFGGFLLTKSDNKWFYNQNFFKTLDPGFKNVALPISHYSTVLPQTGWKLDEIEKKIGIGWGDAFPSKLSSEQKELHTKSLRLYSDDEHIKNAHAEPIEWYETFMKIYSTSTIVVKGSADIDALQNACRFYKIKYTPPLLITDIALWNKISYNRCKTSKLEGTYLCIRPDFDQEDKELEKILPLEKAHDPTTDASMTFLVALYVIKINSPVKSFWSNFWG